MSTSNNNSTVQFSVDASGAEAGVNKLRAASTNANAAMDSMAKRAALVDAAMKEAADNGFELNARAANKLAAEYMRLADNAGKTQAQILAQKAANTGVTSTFASMQSQIAAATAETHGFSFATAASKRELVVLAHELSQGNYKKFGGSLMVLAEQTGAAGLLFSGLGVAALAGAAGVAAVAYEAIQGAKQFGEFNKAISATGGFIGLSATQMEDLSSGLMGTGQSLSVVHEAMAQVAATGAFTADNLRLATIAALDMASDIGIGTDKAAESLAKIQDNVIEWMTKYQQAHHTFSAAQVDEIENFVKQGDTASAVKEIMLDLASAHDKIAADADKNMGSVINWWHEWGDVISRVKAGILGIGVPDSMTKQIGDQMARISAAQLNITEQQALGMHGNVVLAQQQLEAENKKLGVLRDQQAVTFQTQKKQQATAVGGDAAVRAHTFLDDTKYANPADKHQIELDANAKNFATATKDLDKNGALYAEALKRNNDNIAQINAEYAKRTRGKSPSENGIQTMLAALASSQADRVAIEKNAETQLKAQRDAGLIDTETYFKKLHDTQYQALTDEIAIAQQRADVAGQKREKQAQATALGDVKKLSDARAALEQNLNDSLRTFYAQRGTDVQKYADTESAALRNQMAVREQSYATMFLSPDAKANSDASFALQQQYYKKLDALQKQYDSPTADQERYAAEREIAKTYYDAQVADLQASQATQLAIRSSYSDQVRLAMVQMAGTTKTNAELAADAFSTSFNDMQNALETFVTTGKFSFSSFASSVTADLAKIALKAAESQIFNAVLSSSSFFSDGGPVGHFASGGNISGPGTGTSDSIPAMLSNGEFIVRATQAKKYGSLLESINNGRMSHYASGGAVGSVPASSGGGTTQHSNTFNLQSGGLTKDDLLAIAPDMQNLIDKRIAQKFMGQGGLAWKMKYNQI
jgi:lambda family phage tail tape measure protein